MKSGTNGIPADTPITCDALFHEDGSIPERVRAHPNWVFVFGSNLAGRHGAGAALAAREHFGARTGHGAGLAGRSWAIATKDAQLRVLPLKQIALHVQDFIEFARVRADTRFFVTRVGCGLAGYPDADIAPLFERASANCSFAQPWRPFLAHRAGLRHAAIVHDPALNDHPLIRQSHDAYEARERLACGDELESAGAAVAAISRRSAAAMRG